MSIPEEEERGDSLLLFSLLFFSVSFQDENGKKGSGVVALVPPQWRVRGRCSDHRSRQAGRFLLLQRSGGLSSLSTVPTARMLS